MYRCAWLILAMGCSFEHGMTTGDNPGSDSGTPADSSQEIDAMTVSTIDAQECWTVTGVGVNFCLSDPLGGTATVTANASIDTAMTGTQALQCKTLVAGSSDVCVVAADTMTINATRTLSAHGAKPLVLLATTITINGTIDVASHVASIGPGPGGSQTGPGANMAGCNAGNDPSGGGGGQGGSLGTKGGDGGDQDGQNNSRGTAGNALTVTTLRGGCAGADGGGGGGEGGDGGGAVLLVADTIVFGTDGKINASGASGRGASQGNRGGGGAGSGGMIALSANSITVGTSSQIFANGGHGGGGSTTIGIGASGSSGTDSTSPTSTGGGGNGGGQAGNGGDAYPASDENGDGATGGNDGGGGGGGGAGIIRNFSTSSLGTNVSPPPS